MTVRGTKTVPEIERRAIAMEVRRLLGEVVEPSGGKKWTQDSLGQAVGLSQEGIRKARSPNRVGPQVRDKILKFSGVSMLDLIAKHLASSNENHVDRRGIPEYGISYDDPYPSRAELALQISVRGVPGTVLKELLRLRAPQHPADPGYMYWMTRLGELLSAHSKLAAPSTLPPKPRAGNSNGKRQRKVR